MDWIEFYAVSAIFQPCNGGSANLKTIWRPLKKINYHEKHNTYRYSIYSKSRYPIIRCSLIDNMTTMVLNTGLINFRKAILHKIEKEIFLHILCEISKRKIQWNLSYKLLSLKLLCIKTYAHWELKHLLKANVQAFLLDLKRKGFTVPHRHVLGMLSCIVLTIIFFEFIVFFHIEESQST